MTGSPRFVVVLLVLSSASTAPPASANVVDSSPSGFTIENSAIVPVNAVTVWDALVHEVDSWWPKDHSWWGKESKFTIDARAGGCFCEITGDRQAQHLQVVFVNPPTLLRMTGALGPIRHGPLRSPGMATADNGWRHPDHAVVSRRRLHPGRLAQSRTYRGSRSSAAIGWARQLPQGAICETGTGSTAALTSELNATKRNRKCGFRR